MRRLPIGVCTTDMSPFFAISVHLQSGRNTYLLLESKPIMPLPSHFIFDKDTAKITSSDQRQFLGHLRRDATLSPCFWIGAEASCGTQRNHQNINAPGHTIQSFNTRLCSILATSDISNCSRASASVCEADYFSHGKIIPLMFFAV